MVSNHHRNEEFVLCGATKLLIQVIANEYLNSVHRYFHTQEAVPDKPILYSLIPINSPCQ